MEARKLGILLDLCPKQLKQCRGPHKSHGIDVIQNSFDLPTYYNNIIIIYIPSQPYLLHSSKVNTRTA